MATDLECLKISPPADTVPEFSLPIVFFDMLWYDFAANQSVLFFEFPSVSKSQFLNTIVPHLKSSLSLTLTHFLPLAGNIIHPLNPAHKPILLYQSGDSVNFTVSESDADFNHLIGNNPRNCEQFYSLAPQLPPATRSENSISCPVLALQVTLFAGKGISIGFVTHHAIADASTVVAFIHTWGNINIHGGLNNSLPLPNYDRNSVINLNGLDSLYWDLIAELSVSIEQPPVKIPTNKVRSTFVLKKVEIEKLKNLVIAKFPCGVAHLSSFTIVCAIVWVCYARSAAEEVADDEPEYFGFVADCRRRLNPPLPDNYFGNCVALVRAELKHGEVKGSDGFVTAARAVGEAIKGTVYGEKGILHGAASWPAKFAGVVGKRVYGVAGSPRFDFYAADFGWGKPRKFEALFIDGGGSISLCKSRGDVEGGLEIGLSMPVFEMDAFSRVFKELLID